MNENFSLSAHWIPRQEQSRPEDVVADIRIDLLEKNLTENYDLRDNAQKSSVALAPYPMALWFVSNWWRLRWEPTPQRPSTDWRMSHLLSAAGYGYSWPTIGFQTDGETIRITSLPTTGTDGSSVIYLTPFSALISAKKFEQEIASFVDICNEAFGETDVLALWNILQDEQNDRELAMFRQIEARLGFDAGEGPEEAVMSIMNRARSVGAHSVQELSYLLHNDALAGEEILALEKHEAGIPIRISSLAPLRELARQERDRLLPWDLGYALAREARRIWGIRDVFSTEDLCGILETSPDRLFAAPHRNNSFGLGARRGGDNAFSVLLNKRQPTAIRFMVSRLICDAVIAPEDDTILPATADKTARQKTQRAFAAELLCPIEQIRERMGDDYRDEDLWGEMAEDFNVNPLVIKTQLANHHLIPQFENTDLWFDSLPLVTPAYATQEFM